jgi:hypothetical protein
VKVVYIAGPYRAPSPDGIRANLARAASLAIAVWRQGYVALCPHLLTSFELETPTGIADEVWLAGVLALLRRCDAVALVEGWERSEGTLAELREARALGLPVVRPGELGRLHMLLTAAAGERR